MNFNLTAPCGNCPFLLQGAIELRDGRLAGIMADLLRDDFITFPCHKTTFDRHVEKRDTEPSACAGALIWQDRRGRISVMARYMTAMGSINWDKLRAQRDRVVA